MARPERFERPTLWFVGKTLNYLLFINSHLERLPIRIPAYPSHNHVTPAWADAQIFVRANFGNRFTSVIGGINAQAASC